VVAPDECSRGTRPSQADLRHQRDRGQHRDAAQGLESRDDPAQGPARQQGRYLLLQAIPARLSLLDGLDQLFEHDLLSGTIEPLFGQPLTMGACPMAPGRIDMGSQTSKPREFDHAPIRADGIRMARDRAATAQQAARRAADRRSTGVERHLLGAALGLAVARSAGARWPSYDLLHLVRALAQSGRWGSADGCGHRRP
jgi:hypothetical protein